MAEYYHGRLDTEKYNPNKVIVNYLPDHYTDLEMSSLFGTIGVLKSCNIVRDRVTGISLGFGFAEYESEDDATRAIEKFNGLHLQQKCLRVAYARWPGTPETVGVNVHIRNLDSSVTVEQVEQHFSQFGEIIRARVLKDQETGHSRGIAFVLFAKREDAEQAVNTLNGVNIPRFANGALCVRFAIDKKTKAQALFAASTAGIGGFPVPNPLMQTMPHFANSREMLLGSGYETEMGGGSIRPGSLKHRYNPIAGVGHVNGPSLRASMSNVSGFANSATGLRGSNIHGALNFALVRPHLRALKNISAASLPRFISHPLEYQTVADVSAGHIIFIYNLEPEADDRDLWQLFAPYGAVQKVNIIMDKQQNKCKGYGFVTMTHYEEAMIAISQLNGFTYKGKQLQVSLKTPKRAK